MKPQPESCTVALDKPDCAANECFFIDGKLDNVLGARDFEMQAVQFTSEENLQEVVVKVKRDSF